MTNTKELPSLPGGSQILLIVGRIPQARILKSATPFPATRILLCLRPSLGEILIRRSQTKEGISPRSF
jgi:hypothetical protein